MDKEKTKKLSDNNGGILNTGDYNSGHFNSGHYNSGIKNSGDFNSGDFNSGHFNSGNKNSGNFNSGDFNSGYFNIDSPKLRFFGKDTNLKIRDIDFPDYFYFDLISWISYDEMSDLEKRENPFSELSYGYLKEHIYKEAWLLSFEDEEDLEEIKKTFDLPNFDFDIFEEITGISRHDFKKKLGSDFEVCSEEIIVLNGKKYKLIE